MDRLTTSSRDLHVLWIAKDARFLDADNEDSYYTSECAGDLNLRCAHMSETKQSIGNKAICFHFTKLFPL